MLLSATLLTLLAPSEMQQVELGRSVGRLVRTTEDGDVIILGAAKVAAPRDTVFRWTLDIGNYRHSPLVIDAGGLEDLGRLRLAQHETVPASGCMPGRCGVKLTAAEIGRLRGLGVAPASDEVRRILLDAVAAFRAEGSAGLGIVHDKPEPVDRGEVSRFMLASSVEFRAAAPCLYRRLEKGRSCGEDLFYWSRENYGFGFKPTMNLYHVASDRTDPALDVVVSQQLRSTHYFTGSLSVTYLTDAPDGGTYLVYKNHSRVDLLRGAAGWKRKLFEIRVPREIRKQLEIMRRSAERYALSD